MDSSKLEKLFEQQMKLMEMIMKSREPTAVLSKTPTATAPSIDGFSNSVNEFTYNLDSNVTFDTWFRRYEGMLEFDFVNQEDSWKVRLLLRKLGPAELDKYTHLILPANPHDRTFDETISSLRKLLGD